MVTGAKGLEWVMVTSVESGEKSKDSKDLKSHRDSNDPQIAGHHGHQISSAANLYCQAAEG